jgi:glutathione S-transferase
MATIGETLMTYQLYYWPGIQGRGEFVRLALEESGVAYQDVARDEGIPALMAGMTQRDAAHPPFAPPFIVVDGMVIGQTANILYFLGPRLGLAPEQEAGRRWVNQLQLTIADIVTEAHDTHHPVSSGLYYDDQKSEALRRSHDFTTARMEKFLRYFEGIVRANPDGPAFLAGPSLTYADLSMFQLIEGLTYAFPKAMAHLTPGLPHLMALHGAVAQRPRIAAYLQSPRRLPFNEQGIFRHYPELDADREAPQTYANPT